MTVYTKQLPIRGCSLLKEPVLVLSSHNGTWFAPVVIFTYSGEFITTRIPVGISWDRSRFPGRFPTTQEVAASFQSFHKEVLHGGYSVALEARKGQKGIRVRLQSNYQDFSY